MLRNDIRTSTIYNRGHFGNRPSRSRHRRTQTRRLSALCTAPSPHRLEFPISSTHFYFFPLFLLPGSTLLRLPPTISIFSPSSCSPGALSSGSRRLFLFFPPPPAPREHSHPAPADYFIFSPSCSPGAGALSSGSPGAALSSSPEALYFYFFPAALFLFAPREHSPPPISSSPAPREHAPTISPRVHAPAPREHAHAPPAAAPF